MNISHILKILKSGKPVILPTDTFYAISADASSADAVRLVYELKKRDKLKSLPILVSSLEEAIEYAIFNEVAIDLAKKFWPGALTIVCKSKNKLANNLSSNDTIALRVPNNSLLLEIISLFGTPIVGTSANISSEPNIYKSKELLIKFKDIVEIFADKDIPESTMASTIVDCTQAEAKLLRAGSVLIS